MRNFNPPPGWPPAPTGWVLPAGWKPDPSWPKAPEHWQYWIGDDTTKSSSQPWYTKYAWIPVLVVGVVAYVIVLNVMVATQNLNLFPTLLVIGALTMPLTVLLLEYGDGRGISGHAGLVATTMVAGGLLGILAASVVEYSTLSQMSTPSMLLVGIIEEAAKLIVPVALWATMRQRLPHMGLVLGVASGAGFAFLETMGYGLTALVAQGGGVAAADVTLLLRGLLSPAGHVAWTGMTGWALWQMGTYPARKNAVPIFIGAYVLAVILHALWDGTKSLPLHIGLIIVSIGLLLSLSIISRRRRDRPAAIPGPDRAKH